MLCALDSETTGIDLRHGCRPFLFGGMDENGSVTAWRWRVNPLTREVEIPNSEKLEVREYLDSFDELIWWNSKFDISGLELSGIPVPPDIWEKSHDGILADHALFSSTGYPHDLKGQSLKHLDILDTDEKELGDITKKACRIADDLGWRIARPQDPHWPAMKSGEQWWRGDYWIPGELVQHGIEDERIEASWAGICETYWEKDLQRTLGMWWFLSERLKSEGLWEQYDIRKRMLRPVFLMEKRGLTFRKFVANSVHKKHSMLAETHREHCLRAVGHAIDNLESPKQLSAALYNILGLPILKRTEKAGNPSTDKDTLEALQEECRPASPAGWFLRHLMAYRKRGHAAESVESWKAGALPFLKLDGSVNDHFGILCPNCNITGTRETRTSTNNPNGQNISKGEGLPKEEKFNLRDLFGPAPGRLWYSHDYSNIEMRIFAYLADETDLLDAFAAGESVHLLMCQVLYPELMEQCAKEGVSFKDKYKDTLYQWVKNGNFSLIYGAGVKRADRTYHFPGAYKMIRKRFKKIDRFMTLSQKEAADSGYVTTLGGYRLEVFGGAHKAVNYKVQGSAGWAMCLAMVEIQDYLDTLRDHHMIMIVHDEYLHDVPINHAPKFPYEIRRRMEKSGDKLGLPLPVEMGLIRTSWDAEEDVPVLRLAC